jgi:hypothetical protein
MSSRNEISFDPQTVRRLEEVLDDVWRSLSSERRRNTTKSHIAQRIIALAAQGMRDPDRLRAFAVSEGVRPGEP